MSTTRTAAPPAPSVIAYARGPFVAGGVVILDDEEAHHLRVRRIADGAPVRLIDGRGGVASARLALEGEVVAARVMAATVVPAPPVTDLLVGAGDRDRFLGLVEKATELGATRIVPLVTERSQTVATRFQSTHVEKGTRRAREALKQCGAAWVPAIVSPAALSEAVRLPGPASIKLVADVEGGPMPPLREGDAVSWAVGPEGGFSGQELALLRAAGFRGVALGRAVLRFDTAALAALALTAAARLGSGESA